MASQILFLTLLLSSTTLLADVLETPKTPILIEAAVQTKAPAQEFLAYEEALAKVYDDYRKRLQEYWPDPRLSSKMRWVSYTPDNKSRTIIDFSEREIILETVSPNRQKAYNDLHSALRRVITIDTRRAYENDPLQKQLARIRRPASMVNQLLTEETILRDVLFGNSPTDQEIDTYITTNLNQETITPVDGERSSKYHHYQVHIPLPEDIIQRYSLLYRDTVAKASQTYKLPAPLIFAIIQTKSSYNPFSTTYLTAYGLMSISPLPMGEESYAFIHGERKIPTTQYLYDSRDNIELGTAYLHLLYYRHLKDIVDKNSRLYCTIVAYEAGVENLAQAFLQDGDIDTAIAKINTLGSKEVYRYLQENLRHDAAKHFLQDVIKNMIIYHEVYGEDGRR